MKFVEWGLETGVERSLEQNTSLATAANEYKVLVKNLEKLDEERLNRMILL